MDRSLGTPFNRVLGLAFALNAADLITTVYGLSAVGAVEMNPIMGFVIGIGFWLFALIKLGVWTWGTYRLHGMYHGTRKVRSVFFWKKVRVPRWRLWLWITFVCCLFTTLAAGNTAKILTGTNNVYTFVSSVW